MAERQKLAPDQYSPIESDLAFTAGVTRTVAPEDSATPNDLRFRGADAEAASNASGGDALLSGGEKDGTGCRGRVRVENTALLLDQTVAAEICPRNPTQVGFSAEDDGGDTEFYIDTPQGKIQATKDGALNVTLTTTTPAVDSSVYFDKLSVVTGGSPPPTPNTLADFRVLDYPAGADREAVGQSVIRRDFRDQPGDVVEVVLKYAIGAGANTTVRLQTYGQAGNTVLAPLNYDLDVSAVTPGEITESPVIRTVSGALVDPLADFATVVKRLTFGGEFTGVFKLVSVVYRFKSYSVTVVLSESQTDFFAVSGVPAPIPGELGAFKVVDYPAGELREAVAIFTIPSSYQVGSDVQLRLCYAMDTLDTGSIQIATEIFVNNVSSDPSLVTTFSSAQPANEIQPSSLIRVLSGLQRLDTVAVRVRRTGFGTHTGVFRLVSAHLVMGSAVVTATDLLEQTYASHAEFGTSPPTTTSDYVQSDGEVYKKALGIGGTNNDVTFAFRGQVPSNRNEINFIAVPHKVSLAAGNNGVTILVVDETGATIYTGSKLSSVTRALETVSGASLIPNPGPGERFVVLVKAEVDNNNEIFVGAEITVGYS